MARYYLVVFEGDGWSLKCRCDNGQIETLINFGTFREIARRAAAVVDGTGRLRVVANGISMDFHRMRNLAVL